jgi:hypothetical protein
MYRVIFYLICFATLLSCGTYKSKVRPQSPNKLAPESSKIIHTSYLIGDAGNAKLNEEPPAIQELYPHIEKADKNSSLFFLGDNVYEDGIAESGHKEEILSRHRLQVQIDLAKSFKGRSFFIPGNHDWGFGKDAILRQQEMIETQLIDSAYLPDEGCPGPELIRLDKNILAIVFDSEWFLGEYPSDSKFTAHCENKSREELLSEIEEIISENKEKTIILALHHPLYSYGPHGGYYSTKDHLFPLTNLHPSLYLPLPIIGSLVALVRRNIRRYQDIGHERHILLRDSFLKMTESHQRIIVVSGHEHTQQWIKKEHRHFIISGAGSKIDPAKLGKDALFASGKPGFSALDFYASGEVWIRFYSIEEKGSPAQLILHAPVFDKLY